jgi:hypothetical protein
VRIGAAADSGKEDVMVREEGSRKSPDMVRVKQGDVGVIVRSLVVVKASGKRVGNNTGLARSMMQGKGKVL